jgi:hypothetical protein
MRTPFPKPQTNLCSAYVLTILQYYPTDPLTSNLATARWEVSHSPGAPTITLNGTVEQVYGKLLELNPNYDEDWAGVDEDDDVDGYLCFDTDADTNNDPNDLQTRTIEPLHPRKRLTCEGTNNADQWHIRQGIKYLRKVKGKPTHLLGQCGQVSCSGDSEIWWCNFVSLVVQFFFFLILLLLRYSL